MPFAHSKVPALLNREELQNELLDTLGVDHTLYNLPAFVEFLPPEGRVDGFETVGAFVLSEGLRATQARPV
jgi:hypothetical protein